MFPVIKIIRSSVLTKAKPSLILNLGMKEIGTSASLSGKRNFRKFKLPNKRGFNDFKKQQSKLGLVDHQGVRLPGYTEETSKTFKVLPEMVPELIVPDLTGFELKPYVSYQAAEIEQPEFTAEDLFNSVYSIKIIEDFKSSKLDENGQPLEPSELELLTPEEAKLKARQTGSDMYCTLPDLEPHLKNWKIP